VTDARVVDASVLVDLATLRRGWRVVAERLAGVAMHAPAHVDVEVMSALARLSRAGTLTDDQANVALDRFRSAPITRHGLTEIVVGAWARIDRLRVADALYVELAALLGTRVLTSDARLARASELAELVD
jgi:predicted nucleic acid-binding protein